MNQLNSVINNNTANDGEISVTSLPSQTNTEIVVPPFLKEEEKQEELLGDPLEQTLPPFRINPTEILNSFYLQDTPQKTNQFHIISSHDTLMPKQYSLGVRIIFILLLLIVIILSGTVLVFIYNDTLIKHLEELGIFLNNLLMHTPMLK